MANPLGKQLCDAAKSGRAAEMASLLKDNPGFDVNWTDSNHWTAMHIAAISNQVEALRVLLAHPDIDVNVQSTDGYTPLAMACGEGEAEAVRELLKDPRVDLTLEHENGCTALWGASCEGHLELVEWFVASGRDLRAVLHQKGEYMGEYFSPIEIARASDQPEIESLLKRYLRNPGQTRYETRAKLEVLAEFVAEFFALTHFLSGGLLQLKPAASAKRAKAAIRFFSIAKRLPMELQMRLCYRVVGSSKQKIRHQDSEAAFKALAVIV